MKLSDEQLGILLRNAATGSGNGFIIFDPHNACVFTNDSAIRLLNDPPFEEPMESWLPESIVQCVRNNVSDKPIVRMESDQWLQVGVESVETEAGTFCILQLRDVTLEQRQRRELERDARTDPLSGLLNRREFRSELESRQDQPVWLALMDVDFFKGINDQHGHLYGDEAIISLASWMKDTFDDALSIARLGGDEFGILGCAADTTRETIHDRFTQFVQRVAGARFSDRAIRLTISVGVAEARTNQPARQLLSCADEALYEAKREGRNRVVVRNTSC